MGKSVKLRLNQGETESVKLEEESDREIACDPYYFNNMANI
jgi:hypothetical protein